jgi:hypothetical protein
MPSTYPFKEPGTADATPTLETSTPDLHVFRNQL